MMESDEIIILKEQIKGIDKMSTPPKLKYIYNSLTVFPRRAVLRVGMLLRDSEIAKKVRDYLLDVEEVSTDKQREWGNSLNGKVWFVAKDVCDVLEISKYRDAVQRLDNDEGGPVVVDTPGGKQSMAGINEPGLYSLILRSRKEEVKKFKRWVTHEALPAIR